MSESSKRMSVTEHLEELRSRLIKALLAVGLLSAVGFLFSEPILEFLLAPAKQHVEVLYFFGPTEAFIVRLKVALFGGIVLAMPVILYQFWMFVAPGLYKAERTVILPSVFACTILFMVGVVFAFTLALPLALEFLIGFQTKELQPLLAVDRYLSFAMLLLVCFGLTFDLPVFIVGMVKLHILNAAALRRARKAVIVGLFVLSAMITPGDIVATQILLAFPLIILYELSIYVAQFVEHGERGKQSP